MNEHVIQDIPLDFILSREAKLCSPATLGSYERMLDVDNLNLSFNCAEGTTQD
jgi:hypothetical protein